MDTKHTPGPWRITKSPHAIEYSHFIDTDTLREPGDCHEVATIHGTCNPDTERANAALIAAAPDLLAALEECRRALNYHGITGDSASFMADAAIRKAEGETG